MYESPIEVMFREIENRIREQEENTITAEVSRQMGVNVDKDELMKALAYDRGQYHKGYEDAKRAYKQEWIPVSEGLPEIATRCVVQLSNGYITIGEYFSIEKWTLIETSLWFVYPKETVTAWQPLPQPYKEETDDEEEC